MRLLPIGWNRASGLVTLAAAKVPDQYLPQSCIAPMTSRFHRGHIKDHYR